MQCGFTHNVTCPVMHIDWAIPNMGQCLIRDRIQQLFSGAMPASMAACAICTPDPLVVATLVAHARKDALRIRPLVEAVLDDPLLGDVDFG